MSKEIDLTKGPITKKLVQLALPIMGGAFIQMAYNMADMFWVGKLGSGAVAAVGTAGFYTWLAMAFIMISKTGAEVKVAQSIGQANMKKTKGYILSSLQLNIILAVLYGVVMFVWCDPLIGFFGIQDQEVIELSKTYLYVMAVVMVFYFINPVLSGIFNGSGDSVTPFWINMIGLVFNMIFDPILIFGLGPFPSMGVFGAAIATAAAQVVVTICFVVVMIRSKKEYLKPRLWQRTDKEYIREIVTIGMPTAVQSGLFTLFSMALGKIVADFGPVPIAVQKVGSQIEAISWMSAGGFSTALAAFAGQNYGAREYKRISKGYNVTMLLASALGVFSSFLLIFFGRELFSIFIQEQEAIKEGAIYLKILGYSQLFMCIEITATGVFNGIGRTGIPAVISILFTGARVPLAYLLAREDFLGLEGIWWSITLTSIIKGILLTTIYIILVKRDKLYLNKEESISAINSL